MREVALNKKLRWENEQEVAVSGPFTIAAYKANWLQQRISENR